MMRRLLVLAHSLLVFAALGAASSAQAATRIPPAFLLPDEPSAASPTPVAPRGTAPPAAIQLSEKTQGEIRTMVGQMLVVGFPGTRAGEDWPNRMAKWVESGQVGGTILFGNNVVSADQLKALVKSIIPLNGQQRPFVGVDQEGGLIQRLPPAKGFLGLPSAQEIGQLDPVVAAALFKNSAHELSSFGININFGPVVDLNVNPMNPAIGRLERSFGTDPAKVVSYAREFIDAHKQAGVLTSIKHFPGHGSAKEDPHEAAIVDISKTWSEKELIPFRELIADNSAQMVMVGHLIHPRFSDGNLPASLSKKAIDGVLRTELGFHGLVVTDDLDMGAIRDRYSVEQAAVLAIGAGADLIIVANNKLPDPQLPERISAAVIQAVAENRIPMAKLEASYRRIRAAKEALSRNRSYVWSTRP
jgi:beta-N-acetylhexosaminidase